MHVGYVLNCFPKLSETFILNELLELERQGDTVTVFSLHLPRDARFHPAVNDLQAEVIYLGSEKATTATQQLREQVPSGLGALSGADLLGLLLGSGERDAFKAFRYVTELTLEARRRGVERLHAHFAGPAARYAAMSGRWLEIPSSFTCHAKDIYHDSVVATDFRWLHDQSSLVVTVCEANREYIETHLLRRPSDRLKVLYNGVDLERIHPSGRDARPGHVLAVGRLIEKKGFRHLIDAVALLRNRGRRVTCKIVGDGRERAALEQQISRLDLGHEVRLLGARSHDDVVKLLGESEVVVLPCVVAEDGNRDALPTVLLEALAAGVPVVSTPVVGVEEILGPGPAGRLVPAEAADALADAMEEILRDAALREQLALRGRDRAEELFSLSANVGTLRGYFASPPVGALA